MGDAVRRQVRGIAGGLMSLAFLWGCGDMIEAKPAPAAQPPAEVLGRTSYLLPGDCPESTWPGAAHASGLLCEERYAELEALLTDLDRAYAANPLCEPNITKAYEGLGEESEERLAALAHWVEARPDSFQAHIARAEALVTAGYQARGRRWARDTPEENFERMREYFREAFAELDAAESIHPYHMYATAIALRILRAHGSAEQARRVADRYLEHDPLSYVVRFRLIEALEPRWGGSLQDVRRVAEEAQATVDRNPRLRILLGFEHAFRARIAYQEKKTEEVVAHYTRALAYGDDGTDWSLGRATANKRADRMAEASRDINRVLELRPDYAYALAIRASIRMVAGAEEKALEDLNRAIELSPEYAWPRQMRGKIHQGKRRWQEAVSDYEVSLQGDPNDTWVLGQTGYLYLRWLKQPEKAIPPLLRSVSIEPGDGYDWYYLARAQELAGDPSAGESYRRFLSLTDEGDPSNATRVADARKYLDPDSKAVGNAADAARLPGRSLLETEAP